MKRLSVEALKRQEGCRSERREKSLMIFERRALIAIIRDVSLGST
jgi:hypothetical protein